MKFLRTLPLWIHLFAAAAYADVIYLNNGSVLVVYRAWEEGDEVKYETSSGIQAVPKSSVRSVHREKQAAPSGSAEWSRVGDGSSTSGAAPSPAPPIVAPAGGATMSKEALARLRANLAASPSDSAARIELANALNSAASLLVSQGDLASARTNLEEAVKLDPRNAILLSNLGTVEFRLGDYQKAEDLLQSSLAIDRKRQWTYLLLGETLYREEKITQAISAWKEGLQLGPNEAITSRLEQAQREAGVHDGLSPERSAHFILRYDSKTSFSHLGQQILDALEEQYRHLSSELSSQAPATVAVILYPDRSYFDVTRAPGWAGGTYDGKIRIPVKGLWGITSQLKSVLAHELTHCFMAALPGRGTPVWFLEGVAQVQEGRTGAEDRKVLAQMQKENRLIPLENLRGSFTGLPAGAASIAYAESLSAVEYLTTRFGRSAVRSLLDLLAQNYNFETAFSTAFQHPLPEFESSWQQDGVGPR
jgi:hypothetical protein